MNELKLDIRDLAFPCSTRVRAKEAIKKLRDKINGEEVILDLTTIKSISLSFLDELIFWIAHSAGMRKITFLTDDKIIQGKLVRIADIRQNYFIKYMLTNGTMVEISPKTVEPIKARFIESKISPSK